MITDEEASYYLSHCSEEQITKWMKGLGRIKELVVEQMVDEHFLRCSGDARGFQEHLWRKCEQELVQRLIKERLFNKTTVKTNFSYCASVYSMSGMVLVPR